jgi:hypothetical protein
MTPEDGTKFRKKIFSQDLIIQEPIFEEREEISRDV